jgi:TPR repeat protein
VARATRYAAPLENGVRVRCMIRFKVKFGMYISARAGDDLKAKFDEARRGAEGGDPTSQFVHGLVLDSRPDLNPGQEMAMTWYLKAAQGGSSAGQFMVGYNTFNGFGAERDEAKGRFWLQKAASHGQVNAQVALANYLMRPGTTPADHLQALDLLESAVTGGNTDARYYLAALLAAGPESDRRDPRRALSLLENVMRDVDVDPSSFEIRAAAHAMIGEFDEAQRDQKKAMAVAKKLGWDPKPLQERLDRYAARQTWTGELMVY